MKRVLSFLMAALMVVSMGSFVAIADDTSTGPATITLQAGTYFEGENALEPVVLGTSEQTVWSGNVELTSTSENGAGGVTFVYKVEGIKSPISAGAWDVGFNGTRFSVNNWFYNNSWGGKWSRDVVDLGKDGYYYTYLPQRISTAGNPGLIKTVESFVLFKSSDTHPVVNKNEGAALTMLAILDNNLNPTVNFYDAEGNFIASASKKYTSGADTTGSVVWDSTPAAHGMLLTPTELLQTVEGAVVPSKEADAQYRYRLVWEDSEGNAVEGVYKSQDLYATFEAIDNTISTVTFLDAEGNELETTDQKKGDAPVFGGANPEKEADDDYTYTFAGWSLNGVDVIALEDYVLADNFVTFYPVYKEDLKLKAEVVADAEVAMGAEFEVGFKLNRTDLAVDVLAGTVEDIVSGDITVKYNKAIYSTGDETADAAGEIIVPFTSVAEDGTVDATLTMTATDSAAGKFAIEVTTGKAVAETVNALVYATSTDVTVTGQQAGAYFDLEPVLINKNEGETGPASQTLWEGVVYTGGSAGVTFVYKLEGIESEIIADNLNVVLNGNVHAWNSWNWQNGGNTGGEVSAQQKFSEDGYYFMYVNKVNNGGYTYNTVNSFRIFQHPGSLSGSTRTNANENATFQMLAIVANDLAPTVNFYNGEELVTTYTHAYTNSPESNWGSTAKEYDKLISAEEMFVLAQTSVAEGEPAIENPTKEGTIPEVTYEFDGWVDAEGNRVEGVYMSGDVYASFKEIDKRTTYTVKFVNHDGTVLQEEIIPEGILPEYKGFTPKKPSTDTKSYEFKGWDKEIVETPVTSEADGGKGEDIVYTAQFTETERRYDVIFYNEDGETQVAEVLGIEFGGKAETDVVPTKDSDVQYDYTFEKWVAMDGSAVDLENITADLEVKASYTSTLRKYTVTYINDDKETVIGTEEVEYGAEAKGEGIEATKEAIDWYTFEFAKWVDAEGAEADLSVISGDVTVYASYNAVFTHTFEDLDPTRFYGEAVEYCLVNGIMNGTGDTTFSPNGTTTRGQLVTVLHRLEGAPLPAEDAEVIDFEDVEEGRYYTEAVAWASSVGVVKGITATTFEPDTPVTREQFATILYRYAGEVKGYYVEFGRASFDNFEDKKDISSFATKGIKWCIATEDDMYTQGTIGYAKTQYIKGIVEADGLTYMRPQNSATRGEMATILYRFITAEQLDSEGNPIA